MSTDKPWTLDPRQLKASLARWRDRDDPSIAERELVHEWLFKLVRDPLRRASEDPDHPGVFFGRVRGTNVGVLYVPKEDENVVYVAEISSV